MLTSLIAALLSVAPGAGDRCEGRCTSRQATCANSCGGAQHCLQRCGDETSGCLNGCRPPSERAHGDSGPVGNKPRDVCGVNADYTPRFCSEQESKERREAVKKLPKGYACKDEQGNTVLCPDKMKQGMQDPKVVKMQAAARECIASGGAKEKCPKELQEQMKQQPEIFGRYGQ
jgi:hypothetical protein